MEFLKNTLRYLAGQWLVIGLIFLVNVLVARLTGPEGKGLYTLLLTIGAMIILVINLGISRAAIFYINNKTYSLSQMVNHIWTLNLIISGLAIVILLPIFLNTQYGTFIEGISPIYLAIIVLSIPFWLGNLAVSNIFIAVEEFLWANFVPVINALSHIFFVVFLTFVGLGESALVLAIALSAVVACISGWLALRSVVGSFKLELRFYVVKSLLSYGLRAYSYGIASFLNLRLDQFLIGILLNVSQVGIYSIAVAISEIALKVSRAMTTVLFPRVSAQSEENANELTSQVSRTSFVLTLIFGMIFVLFGNTLIRLIFGNKFGDAYLPLIILLPGILAFNLSQILSTDLSGRGRPEIGTYAAIGGIIVTLLGNLALTPIWGLAGAALTASIAYLGATIFTFYAYVQITSQKWTALIIPKRSDFDTGYRILSTFVNPILPVVKTSNHQ